MDGLSGNFGYLCRAILWCGYEAEFIPTIVRMARDICIMLGERVRRLRKDRGWRQIDLAEHAEIHENYVSDLEAGRKEIR